jgi:putative ABC transport system permease protein
VIDRRPPWAWPVRAALRVVPRTWRGSVAQDLDDEAGTSVLAPWWCALEAIGIGVLLHWQFTRAAIMSELRYTVRSMFRAPAFALGAIATFALGIGVNVAVFSAVDRMLFRPLPYADPSSLVVMGEFKVGSSQPYGTVSAQTVVEVRKLDTVVDVTTTDWNSDTYRKSRAEEGARYFEFVPMPYTTLSVLGVHPTIGHDFSKDDATAGRHLVLISDDVWRQEFGARTDVVGQIVYGHKVSDTAQIAGVLPRGFMPPQVTLANLRWNGISLTNDVMESAGPRDRSTPPIVRLEPGVSVAAAQAQIAALDARMKGSQPPLPPGIPASELRLVSLRDALFGPYRTYLLLIFAASTMVLLVGCANLASLLLVRARSREHRAAVQLALGASPSRIVQSGVVEALLLAVLGSAVALVVLRLASGAMNTWLPRIFSSYAAPVFETRVLVFSTALATLSALVAGVLPGWRSSRVDVLAVLQRGTERAGSGPLRGGSTVLAIEIAVSMVLVACAALTGRSLVGLLSSDVGFEKANLYTTFPYLGTLPDPAVAYQRYVDQLAVLRQMPGVAAAAGTNVVPFGGAVSEPFFTGDRSGAQRWEVTGQFVEAYGLRLVAGRTLTDADVQSGAPVGVLSEQGLQFALPGVSPAQAIGRLLEYPNEPPRQIIGVVSDVRPTYVSAPHPSLYVPIGSTQFRRMMYAVRMTAGRTLTADDVTRAVRARGFAPERADATSVADMFDRGVVDQKFRAELFTAFGLVALVLAMVGLYAVQSFHVALRRTEFGIRISLGATPRDLWRMLITQTLRPAVAGIVLGTVVTYWAAQFLQSLLVDVNARGWRTYAVVAAALFTATVVAVWLPARRAARTNPAVVLKAQ